MKSDSYGVELEAERGRATSGGHDRQQPTLGRTCALGPAPLLTTLGTVDNTITTGTGQHTFISQLQIF